MSDNGALTVLDGPRLPPASGTARSLVVFLHGFGADGNDLIDIGRAWAPLLPDTAFASPHAPQACRDVPGGRQWFALRMTDTFLQMEAGALAAAPILDAFLDRELARYRLGDAQLALCGFSQGAMIALEVGPRRKGKIAGIIGYSGMVVSRPERLAAAPHRPPVLLGHGDSDTLIPLIALHGSADALGKAGFAVEWHISRGIGHGIDQTELKLGAEFLRRVLV